MFEISTEASFSAAHHLNNYNGPCENVHGHNWLVRVCVKTDQLDRAGIGIDFKVLKGILRDILARFDHQDLNAALGGTLNPSSENLARDIYGSLKTMIADQAPTCKPVRVTVFETPGNGAAYYED